MRFLSHLPGVVLLTVGWVCLLCVFGMLLITLVETLLWWRLWALAGAREAGDTDRSDGMKTNRGIVFLPGISDYADARLLPEQEWLIRSLACRFPGSAVAAGFLPAEEADCRRYATRDLWRRIGWAGPPLWARSLHNLWQLLLAMGFEKAYGRATARQIALRLRSEGLENGGVIALVCGSAGAQVGLAAAPFLREMFGAEIVLAALGGVYGAPRGWTAISHMAQICGKADGWVRLGSVLFPGRWLPGSRCLKAQFEGRLRTVCSGPHGHFGERGYLGHYSDPETGVSYRELTLDSLARLSLWDDFKQDDASLKIGRLALAETQTDVI